MTLITWTCLRYVQEMATILGPQNRTQGSCDYYAMLTIYFLPVKICESKTKYSQFFCPFWFPSLSPKL